jgi:four helix bundle protein
MIENLEAAFFGRWAMDAEEMKRRTKVFAHRSVKLALALPHTPLGNHIRGQLIRCSTSVPSNYRAACLAQSKAHFASKLSIAAEEADESAFWIEFSVDEDILDRARVSPLLDEANELTAIFIAGRKTAKNRAKEFNNQ